MKSSLPPRAPSFAVCGVIAVLLTATAESAEVDVGVARIEVTPSVPIRLTGYASRSTPSTGVEQKLWAKALAIGSNRQGPALLLTLDNCGIAEATYLELARRLATRWHIKPERLVIACSPSSGERPAVPPPARRRWCGRCRT